MLDEVPPRPAWHKQANCRGTDPGLWFTERGESTHEAKKTCQACAVRAECLAYSINAGERHGIWGGLAERERRRLRRRLGRQRYVQAEGGRVVRAVGDLPEFMIAEARALLEPARRRASVA